jgi:hypothetical protein
MYNSGNSSKNVTGASIVDGTVETVDIADDAVTADKLANSVNTDIATGVAASTTAGDAMPKAGGAFTGAVTTNSTFAGRDVATDGDKLDLVEALADVTDTTNVTSAGALMDSEVTNLAAVKAFDTTDYATSTQGTTADNALPKTGGTLTVGGGATITTALTVAATGNGGTGRGVAISLKPSGTSPGTPSVLAAQIAGLQESASATANNASLAFKVADTGGTLQERMRITKDGNVIIGETVTSASGLMRLRKVDDGRIIETQNGTATDSQYHHYFMNNAGTQIGKIYCNSSSTAYNTTSDYRLKENVVPMTGSIDRLKALKPSRFNFIADTETTVDGFLAHEAQVVVPECATGTKDEMMDEEYEVTPAVMDGDTVVTEAVMGTRSVPEYQGIDQSKLVPLLVAALQEAITRIETLENV